MYPAAAGGERRDKESEVHGCTNAVEHRMCASGRSLVSYSSTIVALAATPAHRLEPTTEYGGQLIAKPSEAWMSLW